MAGCFNYTGGTVKTGVKIEKPFGVGEISHGHTVCYKICSVKRFVIAHAKSGEMKTGGEPK